MSSWKWGDYRSNLLLWFSWWVIDNLVDTESWYCAFIFIEWEKNPKFLRGVFYLVFVFYQIILLNSTLIQSLDFGTFQNQLWFLFHQPICTLLLWCLLTPHLANSCVFAAKTLSEHGLEKRNSAPSLLKSYSFPSMTLQDTGLCPLRLF